MTPRPPWMDLEERGHARVAVVAVIATALFVGWAVGALVFAGYSLWRATRHH